MTTPRQTRQTVKGIVFYTRPKWSFAIVSQRLAHGGWTVTCYPETVAEGRALLAGLPGDQDHMLVAAQEWGTHEPTVLQTR